MNTKTTYQNSLFQVTKTGVIVACIMHMLYSIIYFQQGHYSFAWLHTVFFAVTIFSILLTIKKRCRSLVAHLITLSIFVPTVLYNVYRVKNISWANPWILLSILVITLMDGYKSGTVWLGIGLISVIGMYQLEQQPLLNEENAFLFVDNILLLLAVGAAIIFTEREKWRAFNKLDMAQNRLTEQANNDPLTDLYNRRYFFQQGAQSFEQNPRHNPLSIILFDIDNFKEINDTFGHSTGDLVLTHVADLCRQEFRDSDLVARFGGEEFIALMPANVEAAIKVSERLKYRLNNNPLKTSSMFIPITISMGIAELPTAQDFSLDHLIKLADTAMYRAKEAGKDQIAVWKNELPHQLSD